MEKQAKDHVKRPDYSAACGLAGAWVQPGDALLFETDKAGMRVRPVRTKSPFAKYRGIGNRGIGSGRNAINRWVREMRGR